MPNPDGTPTLEEIRAERERRSQQGRSLRTQAAASGQPVSVEAIRAERARRQQQPQRREPVSTGEDITRSFLSAVPRGAAALAALPRDLNDLSASWAEDNNVFGDSEIGVGARRLLFGTPSTEDTPSIPWISSQEIEERYLTPTIGEPYEPQTTAGEYARTAGEFAPAAVFPWASGARVSRTLVPAIASETAGQLTEGQPYEGIARFAGGFAGGMANEAALAQRAANVRRLGQPAPESQQLEQEFGPLTRGERSGVQSARRDEYRWRQGIGSDQAEATIRGFDAERAPVIRENAMGVVTRGQPALSQDVGEAGVILGDELRTARQAMRDRATAQYERAFEAARQEPIPQGLNETPSVRIAAVADEFGFEVPAPARHAINVLERRIQDGTATHANVERARQALNRELGTAVNTRNDALEFAYSRTIGALDEWQEGAMTNPQTRQAMREARGMYAESQQLFGPRGRTELGSGHTGRMDPGGRAIDRVINTELTGEQIINSIVSSGKPSQQALGAVRRIWELGTGTTSTSGARAEGGIRTPGRTPVGRGRAARRRAAEAQAREAQEMDMRLRRAWQFAADTPNEGVAAQRFGGVPQQPATELQALREGVWHRILSPLDDYMRQVQNSSARSAGILPVQTMRTALDNALNKSGREIMQMLYTPREIAAMQRFLRFLDRLTPPSGSHSPSGPAIYAMVQKGLEGLANLIPGLNLVLSPLRSTSREFSATLAAERAVARPPTSSARRPLPIDPADPSSRAPPVSAALALPPPEEPQRRLGAQ